MVELLTGHCNLRLFLYRIGVYDGVPSCRKCDLNNESATHVFFDCLTRDKEKTAAFGKLTRGHKLPGF